MKNKTFVCRRHWLNPITHVDTGAVSSYLEVNSYYVDCEVELRDCTRQVSLHFGFNNKAALEQRKKKLKLLINTFQELYDNLDEAHEYFCELKEADKKAK